MVAKGSDLVRMAMFVKRAFIELLKKVVSCMHNDSDDNFLMKNIIELFFRVLDQRRQRNSYNTQEFNVRSVMIVIPHQYFLNVVTSSVNCACRLGLIAVSKRVLRVLYVVQK